MRTKSIRPCQAKNPSACPYHGAMGRMEAALKSDDLPAYFEAKASFEEAKKNKSYLEFEANNGRFIVKGNAEVFTEARVYGNVEVYSNAADVPATVYGNFRPLKAEGEVIGVRRVLPDDTPIVSGDAKVYDTPSIVGNAKVYSDITPAKASSKAKPKASDEEKAKAKWFGWK